MKHPHIHTAQYQQQVQWRRNMWNSKKQERHFHFIFLFFSKHTYTTIATYTNLWLICALEAIWGEHLLMTLLFKPEKCSNLCLNSMYVQLHSVTCRNSIIHFTTCSMACMNYKRLQKLYSANLVVWEELNVKSLLIHIKRNQLKGFGHLVRMHTGRLPMVVFRACPTTWRPWGRPRAGWRDYISRLVWATLSIPPTRTGGGG